MVSIYVCSLILCCHVLSFSYSPFTGILIAYLLGIASFACFLHSWTYNADSFYWANYVNGRTGNVYWTFMWYPLFTRISRRLIILIVSMLNSNLSLHFLQYRYTDWVIALNTNTLVLFLSLSPFYRFWRMDSGPLVYDHQRWRGSLRTLTGHISLLLY